MSRRQSRRRFLQNTAMATTGFWVTGGLSQGKNSNWAMERLNIAGIGIGGKGGSDIEQAAHFGNVVALCDIDDLFLDSRYNSLSGKHKNIKKYNDFRKMFDEMGKDIDAVTVGTPDHTHAVCSVMAMKMGKHVYCQKPLTHTVHEARMMRELAHEKKVATQMGNQGSAENGLRRAIELVQSGIIGPVREAHVWTNRPIWPQAPQVMSRPPEMPVPSHVHWDEFIGPAPMRPYAEYPGSTDKKTGKVNSRKKGAYHAWSWRGWWDFGTGALGDMACHTANMAFRALKLGYPTSIVADATDVNPETCPSSAKIVYQFPARGDMPPVTFTWYEGRRDNKKLLPPEELIQKAIAIDTNPKHAGRLVDSGSILVGDKGMLYSPDDYGAQFFLSPAKDFEGVNKTKPEHTPINGKGDSGMKEEWVAAIKGGPAAFSNFDIAGMLTEAMLLGNVAIRTGKKLDWDGPAMQVTNCPEAAQYIKPEYRAGWSL